MQQSSVASITESISQLNSKLILLLSVVVYAITDLIDKGPQIYHLILNVFDMFVSGLHITTSMWIGPSLRKFV